MTVEYRGRSFAVEETGSEREPYRLVGARGSSFTLVRHPRLPILYVRDARGGYGNGFFRDVGGVPVWQRQKDKAAVDAAVERIQARQAERAASAA